MGDRHRQGHAEQDDTDAERKLHSEDGQYRAARRGTARLPQQSQTVARQEQGRKHGAQPMGEMDGDARRMV